MTESEPVSVIRAKRFVESFNKFLTEIKNTIKEIAERNNIEYKYDSDGNLVIIDYPSEIKSLIGLLKLYAFDNVEVGLGILFPPYYSVEAVNVTEGRLPEPLRIVAELLRAENISYTVWRLGRDYYLDIILDEELVMSATVALFIRAKYNPFM